VITPRRLVTVALAIATACAMTAPAVAASRRQGSDSSSVTLVKPAGWFESDDSAVVAQNEADLTAEVPSGPRARIVTVKHPKKTKTKALVKKITSAVESDPELVDGPSASTFGASDVPGTVITFSIDAGGGRIVQRYVLLSPPGGTPTLIVLEAPEDQFAGAEQSLMFAFNT